MSRTRGGAATDKLSVPRASGDEPKALYTRAALLELEKGVPRASGDEPLDTLLLQFLNLCSPRERG